MKKPTNTSELIAAWAAQDAAGGAVSNVSYDGQRLFSYDTCIATLVMRTVDAHAPLRICLTTYRRYSMTTSGHIAAARTAAQQAGLTSIAVASIDAPLDHQRNLLGIAEDAAAHLRRATRARVSREAHLGRSRKRLQEFNLYARFFGLPHEVDLDHITQESVETQLNWVRSYAATESV